MAIPIPNNSRMEAWLSAYIITP